MREVESLVDTGAFYTVTTLRLAAELGLEPQEVASLTLAESRTVKGGITVAYIIEKELYQLPFSKTLSHY
ncbi:MAG: hypothetical protein QXI27_01740 [Nitrososphaerota archaeon]